MFSRLRETFGSPFLKNKASSKSTKLSSDEEDEKSVPQGQSSSFPIASTFPWDCVTPSVPRNSADYFSLPPIENEENISLIQSSEIIEMRPLSNSCGVHVAGHLFRALDEKTLSVKKARITWCDHCLQCIWGDIHARRCIYCTFTCHAFCCHSVQLICSHSYPQTIRSLKDGVDALPISNSPSILQEETYKYCSFDYQTLESDYESLKAMERLVEEDTPAFLHLISEMSARRAATTTAPVSGYSADNQFQCHMHANPINPNCVNGILPQQNGCSPTLSSIYSPYPPVFQYQSFPSSPSPEAVLHAKSHFITEEGLHFRDGTHWPLKEMWQRIDVFMGNQQGLRIALDEEEMVPGRGPPYFHLRCSGTIRVHLVLIRPVNLSSSAQRSTATLNLTPSSFWDAHESGGVMEDTLRFKTIENESLQRIHSQPVWLPRGISKLVRVDVTMSSQDVIVSLLQTFQIKDNPKKFALYEHSVDGDVEVSMRKLDDAESPLLLYLTWAEVSSEEFNSILLTKRLVLQENETNDIEWSGFTLPELRTFLSLLNREEEDYRHQIHLKYEKMSEELKRLLAKLDPSMSDNNITSLSIDSSHLLTLSSSPTLSLST